MILYYQTDTWTMIESMSTRRSSVGVGVVGAELFAVGGYDGSTRQCLNSYVYLANYDFHKREFNSIQLWAFRKEYLSEPAAY